jgi:hypothetical protein
LGKYLKKSHISKIFGGILISFPVFVKDAHSIWNNAVYNNVYLNHLIQKINPAGFVGMLQGMFADFRMQIPGGEYYFMPFYHYGMSPVFSIYKTVDLQYKRFLENINMQDVAIRVMIINFCLRNVNYGGGKNFDTFYAERVLSLLPRGVKKEKIKNILGPLPVLKNISDKGGELCAEIVNFDKAGFEWIFGDYREIIKLWQPFNYVNPPILFKNGVVEEYNMKTVRRGLRTYSNRRMLAFYNCQEFYPYFVGLGTFYMTVVPRALQGEYNIVAVDSVREAKIMSEEKGQLLLMEDLMDETLIGIILEKLNELKLPEAKSICTDNIPVVVAVLKKIYKEVLTEPVNGAVFWNNF